jgi:hypothetical protein
LENGRRQLQYVKPEEQLNGAWQLDLPDEYFQFHRTAKEREKMFQGESKLRKKRQEVETQAHKVLTMGRDKINYWRYPLQPTN